MPDPLDIAAIQQQILAAELRINLILEQERELRIERRRQQAIIDAAQAALRANQVLERLQPAERAALRQALEPAGVPSTAQVGEPG